MPNPFGNMRRTSLKAPSIKSGKTNSMMNSIQLMMLKQMMDSQQKASAQSQLGEGAIPTKSVGENITVESPQSRFFTAYAQNLCNFFGCQ